MKLLNRFPHFKQLDASDCGPTSLRMIASFYGLNILRRCYESIAIFLAVVSTCRA